MGRWGYINNNNNNGTGRDGTVEDGSRRWKSETTEIRPMCAPSRGTPWTTEAKAKVDEVHNTQVTAGPSSCFCMGT